MAASSTALSTAQLHPFLGDLMHSVLHFVSHNQPILSFLNEPVLTATACVQVEARSKEREFLRTLTTLKVKLGRDQQLARDAALKKQQDQQAILQQQIQATQSLAALSDAGKRPTTGQHESGQGTGQGQKKGGQKKSARK